MERLTKRDIEGFPILAKNIDYTTLLDRLAAYEDAGFEPEEIEFCLSGVISPKEAKERYEAHKKRYDEWFAWKQAEEQGRLVILPCKAGDVVYRIVTCPTGRKFMGAYPQYRVRGLKVSDIYKEGAISFYASNIYPGRGEATSTEWFNSADIGKTVFLSREEAEAAIKGGTENV